MFTAKTHENPSKIEFVLNIYIGISYVVLTTKSREISFKSSFHYKKAFQSKVNCLLTDRCIAYQVNKFEQVQRGVFQSDEVSTGPNCRDTQVNKFEQVLLHGDLPVDRYDWKYCHAALHYML